MVKIEIPENIKLKYPVSVKTTHTSRFVLCNWLLISILTFGLSSCVKDDDSEDTDGGAWGEAVDIPGISTTVPGESVTGFRTTNNGVYVEVLKADVKYIYRLKMADGSPQWTFHEPTDLYFCWHPTNMLSESPDGFSIFFKTIDKHGQVNINTGLPSLMEEESPEGATEMLIDNSSGAYTWAFFGSTVKIQDNNNIGEFTTICTLPESITFAEADPYDAVVYAAAGSRLYRITVNGDIRTFDVGSYADGSIFQSSISKVRFPHDELHKDVYFKYQNKVFRIMDGTSLALFHTIDFGTDYLFGGDFCVDQTFMYATDGIKKHLYLLSEESLLPPAPATFNQNVLLEHYTNTNAFKLGPLEVSTNPTDRYIYAASGAGGGQVFKFPKNP